MLYKLEVENFYSVRDRQILDLTIAPNVPDLDQRYLPIFPGSKLRTPKVVAIYGANASGKTNVLRALEFVMMWVRDSVTFNPPGFRCDRFNDEESRSRPVSIAIEFGGAMDLGPDVMDKIAAGKEVDYGVYRYEVEIEVKEGTPLRISRETLRQRPGASGKWQRVFERDAEGKVKDSRSFSLSGFQHLLNTLQPTVSVLSSFAMFQHPAAMTYVEEARRTLFQVGAPNVADQAILTYIHERPDVLEALNSELRRIDVGIEKMHFVQTNTGPVVQFCHDGLEVDMPWTLESHGTQSFIKIFPALLYALENGGFVAIDEMDASIHAAVVPEMIRWFYGTERNHFGAQLWLTCHSASLLDDLNKEEVVICEKDRMGRTTFHSLMDVKTRRDDNLYRKYLSGAVGGVPSLG